MTPVGRISRRRLIVAGTAAAAGMAAYAVSQTLYQRPAPPHHEPIVIATGSSKGVYYQYAREFAKGAGSRLGTIEPVNTTGSVQNLDMLRHNLATYAFSAADAALDAYTGRPPYRDALALGAIARLYDDFVHLVVRAGARASSLPELRGRRVAVGPAGSGTVLIADRVLEAADLDPQRDISRVEIGLDEAVDALRDRKIDAFFWSGGLPTPGVVDLADSTSLKLIDLAEIAGRLRDRYGVSYRTGTIPAGTYTGVESAVGTIAVPNLLVARASLDTTLVYRTTVALFASAERIGVEIPVIGQLDERTAILTAPIPLHDGALAYYRSVKVHV